MGDVVGLPKKPDPLIWICIHCDCTTFRLYSDGTTECSHCCSKAPDNVWCKLPTDFDFDKANEFPKDAISASDDNGVGNIPLMRFRANINHDGDYLAVIFNKRGGLHTLDRLGNWDEDGIAWLKRRFVELETLLKGEKLP